MPSPSPSSSRRTIFIVGSGPMIGSHTARHFVTNGFTHVALFSHSPTYLKRDASFIRSTGPSASIHTYPADVTDQHALTFALVSAITEAGVPEVVIYNAARINYGCFGDYRPEDILVDFKILNLGLYTTASVMLPHLRALATKPGNASSHNVHPSLFVTSSDLTHQPVPEVFSLSMATAAQASLVKTLAVAGENKGVVHVALLTVGGPVSPEEEVRNPTNIAGKFWELYQQKKGGWEFEMRCGW